jgi:hypothetical protein
MTESKEITKQPCWRSQAQERIRHMFDTPDYKSESQSIIEFIQTNSRREREADLANSNSEIAESRS